MIEDIELTDEMVFLMKDYTLEQQEIYSKVYAALIQTFETILTSKNRRVGIMAVTIATIAFNKTIQEL